VILNLVPERSADREYFISHVDATRINEYRPGAAKTDARFQIDPSLAWEADDPRTCFVPAPHVLGVSGVKGAETRIQTCGLGNAVESIER